jgi:exodeoxyribonuclease VII small subunit
MSANPEFKFETVLEKLEKSIREMDSGKLSLEESLKVFEEGVRLIRDCQGYLQTAQKRVEIAIRAPEEGSETPFKPVSE